MPRMPEPDQTPEGPAYEGRLLDRAGEEVVDQGVAFDLRTLFSRRGVLSLVGIGVGTAVLAACSTGGGSDREGAVSIPSPTGSASGVGVPAGEIPDETAGPYPGDGSNGPDILTRSGVVRSDIRSSIGGGATAVGVPMAITLTILDTANGDRPFAGVAVYVWHCDALGRYSMYSSGVQNESYLRGVQIADANGVVGYTSVFPACYSGRWPHIHFEVYPDPGSITDSTSAIATSQVALPQAACDAVYARSEYSGSSRNLSQVSLATDGVFGNDGGALQLGTVTGSADTGYAVSLVVRVDTRTKPTSASGPAGNGGGPGAPVGGTRP